MIYKEKCRIGQHTLIRDISLIPCIDLLLFAGPLQWPISKAENSSTVAIDDWIQFSMDNDDEQHLAHLRSKFASIFFRYLRNHRSFEPTTADTEVLEGVVRIIDDDPIEEEIKRIKGKALAENL